MIKLKATVFNGMEYSSQYFELSEEDYNDISTSREIIKRSYKLEAAFDNLIEAYKDFKVVIHGENVSRLTMRDCNDYVFNHESRAKLNRCLNSVLNHSKFYTDTHVYKGQKKSFILKVTDDPKLHEQIVKEYCSEYDAKGNYFLGTSLRNIAQHRSSLVNNLSLGYDSGVNGDAMVSRFTLPLSKQSILDDTEVRDDIKDIIRTSDIVLDVNVILDGFVYSIGWFHTRNRELSKKSFDLAWNYWGDFVSKYQNMCSNTATLFDIVEVDEEGNEQRHFSLGTDWMQVIPHLINKNYALVDPSKVELSNKPRVKTERQFA